MSNWFKSSNKSELWKTGAVSGINLGFYKPSLPSLLMSRFKIHIFYYHSMNGLTDIFYTDNDSITSSRGSKMPPSQRPSHCCLPLYSFKLGCNQKTLSILKYWGTELESKKKSELWEKGTILGIKLGTQAWKLCTLPTEQDTPHFQMGLSEIYV